MWDLLGPKHYIRHRVFPPERPSPGSHPIPYLESKELTDRHDNHRRIGVHEYKPNKRADARLIVYFHGKKSSIRGSIGTWERGSLKPMSLLANFGIVIGVDLPSYGRSSLTNDNLANIERDMASAVPILTEHVKERASNLKISADNIWIVGLSIGTHMG